MLIKTFFCKYLEKNEFFDDFLVKLNSVSDCDLRKSEECFDAVLELKDTIIITCAVYIDKKHTPC